MRHPFPELDSQYPDKINVQNFREIALALFQYQYAQNPIYKAYVDAIGILPSTVSKETDIPFLPLSFFKTHRVVTGEHPNPALVFESSTTTGAVPSRHYVANEGIYRRSLLSGFQKFYSAPEDYAILALLPSYLERQTASLVHMAQTLMDIGKHPANGFFLYDFERLHGALSELEARGQKTILLGVTFALLDFADAFPTTLRHTLVMETGGMKGRREEWTRAQVHDLLKTRFDVENIHSEYGMTEMLSQAYASRDGLYRCSNTMRAFVREQNDPLTTFPHGSGQLQVIDLANVHSCAFLATEDIGIVFEDGSFQVLGRADHTALRGCSLMAV